MNRQAFAISACKTAENMIRAGEYDRAYNHMVYVMLAIKEAQVEQWNEEFFGGVKQ